MEQREDKEDGVCPSESTEKEDGVCPSESTEKEDGVCPSESTEKEDGVCPSASTLGHQHEDQSKVQRKPGPESSSAESEAESGYSGLSFRSDMSKDNIIDFKSGQPSAERRSLAGPDSPLSAHSYTSCGSNRSTDTDLDFNNQRPIPPESYRRIYEELLLHQQEVIRHQEALLRRQEVQCQQEVQHLHEVIRQQEIQLQGEQEAKQEAKREAQEAKREAQEAKREAQEAKREAQEAKREAKLKCLEDQHLKSGKNHSHESKREPPGLTYSSPYINVTDGFSTQPARLQKRPGLIRSLPDINVMDRFRLIPVQLPTLTGSISSEVESSDLSED